MLSDVGVQLAVVLDLRVIERGAFRTQRPVGGAAHQAGGGPQDLAHAGAVPDCFEIAIDQRGLVGGIGRRQAYLARLSSRIRTQVMA